ncbi:uncharacterized protein DS421_8g241360 [Arachis hypogaea]|nr:uncharacterized protein DS421_8g241360 [Arachis hypogaea]
MDYCVANLEKRENKENVPSIITIKNNQAPSSDHAQQTPMINKKQGGDGDDDTKTKLKRKPLADITAHIIIN